MISSNSLIIMKFQIKQLTEERCCVEEFMLRLVFVVCFGICRSFVCFGGVVNYLLKKVLCIIRIGTIAL